ncbi:MAG: DUF3987 domain-containing protein [Planctomycetes bacterium]|nr:DUF3987 domain-containing protein [Planctomycetota bacterium]
MLLRITSGELRPQAITPIESIARFGEGLNGLSEEAVLLQRRGRLKDFVLSVAECYQVPVDAVALMALPVMALPLSKRFEVEAMRGWREQLSLYVAVLMPSGERKSAIVRQLTEPIYAWQRDQATGMADVLRQFENEEKIAKERLDRARRKAALKPGESGDIDGLAQQLADIEAARPRPPSLIVTDGTSEAIARALVLNHERAMLAAAEGDAIDILMGRYSGAPNFGVWLSGHSGDAVESIRRGREPDRLAHPALQIALFVQPEAVAELLASRQALGRGLVPRFFFSIPESRVGYRKLRTDPVPVELIDYFGARIQQHLAEPVPTEPTLIRLTPDAAECLDAYRERNEAHLRPDGDLSQIRSWGNKLPGGLLRVAGILRAFEPISPLVIDVETLRCALSLGPYLTAHYERTLMLGGDDITVDLAQRIDSWLRRKRVTTFSRRDAFNQVKGRAHQVEVIDPALDLLQERHRIRQRPEAPAGGPGRPKSPVFEVNPAPLQVENPPPQYPHNPQNPAVRGSETEGDVA